jgi:hypothetical protein
MNSDVQNIDAQRGGDCIVLTTVSAEYTLPPSVNRITGFDGVVVLDVGMSCEKVYLAGDCVSAIVAATGSNDRLGLVTFGDGEAIVVSELIMCTTPYKQALQQSITQLTTTTTPGKLADAMSLALGLLGSDARYAGHIFVISDGNSFPSNNNNATTAAAPFWAQSPTTVHCVAVGGLVQMELLRNIRTQQGSLLEFRDTQRDGAKMGLLVGYLATNVSSHAIETVRCRFSWPEDKVSVLEMSTHPTFSSDSASVTISTPFPCL